MLGERERERETRERKGMEMMLLVLMSLSWLGSTVVPFLEAFALLIHFTAKP